eukprot:scaffold766_cov210-Alexandrium_tamarense.AAC.3
MVEERLAKTQRLLADIRMNDMHKSRMSISFSPSVRALDRRPLEINQGHMPHLLAVHAVA